MSFATISLGLVTSFSKFCLGIEQHSLGRFVESLYEREMVFHQGNRMTVQYLRLKKIKSQ